MPIKKIKFVRFASLLEKFDKTLISPYHVEAKRITLIDFNYKVQRKCILFDHHVALKLRNFAIYNLL